MLPLGFRKTASRISKDPLLMSSLNTHHRVPECKLALKFVCTDCLQISTIYTPLEVVETSSVAPFRDRLKSLPQERIYKMSIMSFPTNAPSRVRIQQLPEARL